MQARLRARRTAVRAAFLGIAMAAAVLAQGTEGAGDPDYASMSPYTVGPDSLAEGGTGLPAGSGSDKSADRGTDQSAGGGTAAPGASDEPPPPYGTAEAALSLPEVEVTAEMRPSPPRRQEADPRALAAADLERGVSTFGDPARIARYLPGAGRGNDWSTELIVRGGSPDQSGYVVDGIPLARVSHYEGPRGDHGGIGILNLAFADSVRFHAGTFPARHPDKLSGLVEVDYRDGDTASGHGRIATDVTGAGGSAEGPLPGGKGSYAAAARYSAMDLLIRTGMVEAYGVPEYFNGQARVTVPLGGAALRARFIGGREEWSNDIGGASRLDLDGHSIASSLSLESEGADGRARAVLRYEERAHRLDFASWGERPGNGRDGMSRVEDALERRWGVALDRSVAADGGWTFGIGASGQAALGTYRSRYGDQATYLAYQDTVIQFSQDAGSRRLLASGAVYTEAAWTAGKAELYAGYRHFYEQASREHAPGPRISAAFRPAAGHRLRAAFGLHTQPHDAARLAQSPGRGGMRLPYMAQTEVGWSWTPAPGCVASLDAFTKEGYRLSRQAFSPVGDDYMQAYRDTGRTRARGFEAALRTPRTGRWDLSAGYSFLWYRERGPDGRWNPGPYSLPHTLNLASGLRLARGLWLSGRLSAGSGTPYTPFDSAASMQAGTGVYDAENAYSRIGTVYFRLDARLDWERSVRSARVGLFAEIENLLDRRNESGRQWNILDGRETPIEGMGRLPTAGVSVRF